MNIAVSKRGYRAIAAATVVSVLLPLRAWCVDLTDDRIAVSGNASSLTGTNGGAGASVGWLHNFDPDTLIGVAAEHQVLSVSHWTFGTLSGAITRGAGDHRYTLYGDAHEGAGDDGPNAFKYRIETLGVTGTYFHRLSATVEDKQVNVETTNGNLPKLQFAYLWNPHLLTTVSYAYSFGGNLGTRLTSARIDVYGPQVNFLAGSAIGQASPSLLGNVVGGNLTLAPHQLREGYVGVVKPFASLRSELTFIVDYQRLSGGQGAVVTANNTVLIPRSVSERWTGTLNYVFHIGHHGTK
jgi:hypothetical protein